jgi:translocation and assembly module TamB
VIKRALWIIAITLLLVLPAGLYWLLMTKSGFETALNFTQKTMPELTINEARGRLYDGIFLKGIAYEPEDGDAIYVDTIDARWQLWSLLSSRFIINQVHLNKLQIKQAEKVIEVDDEESFSLPEIHIPLAIHVRSLRITRAELIDNQGVTTSLFDRFDTSLRLNYDRLIVSSLRLNRDVFAFTLLGNVQLNEPYTTNLNYGARLNDPEWGLISATGTITGDLQQMTLRQQLGAPFASEQTIMVRNLLGDLDWRVSIESEELPLGEILKTDLGNITAIDLDAKGTLNSAKLELDFQLDEFEEIHPPLSASVSLSSNDLSNWRVDLMAAISQNSFAELHGDIHVTEDPLESGFAIEASWSKLKWPWQPDTELLVGDASGQLSLDGNLQDYRLVLSSSLSALEQNWTINTNLSGDLQHATINSLEIQSALAELAVSGDVGWDPELRYQLEGGWKNLQLPASLSGVTVESYSGLFNLKGEKELFDLKVDSDFIIDDIPLIVNLLASSPEAGITEIRADTKIADGGAGFSGKVNWKENLLVDGKLTLRQLNPAAFDTEWPGRISGQAQLQFQDKGEGNFQASMQQLHLNGMLRERNFSLDSNLQAINTDVNIEDLLLKLGDSQLSLKGKVEKQLDLSWQLASPNLQDFHPDLSGSLNGQGQLFGELARLKLNAKLDGNAIHWADELAIGSINADAQIDLTDNQQSKLNVQSTQIIVAEQTIDSVDLSLTGKRDQHQLGLQIRSDIVTLSSLLQGSLNAENQWTGRLQSMDINNDMAGSWQLRESGDIQLSADKQIMSQHCWQSEQQAQLCLQGENAEQGALAQVDINQLSTDLFKPWIEEYAKLSGFINGKLQLAMEAEGDITGTGNLSLNEAVLKLESEGLRQQEPIEFESVELRYQLTTEDSMVAITIAPDVAGMQPVEARLQSVAVKTLIQAPMDTPLTLQLQTSVEDLAALNLETLAFDELAGKLELHVDMQGTVNQPELSTAISLRDGQIFLVDMGITLSAINGDIKGDPLSGVKMLLQAQSAEGQLEIAGDFSMTDADWLLNATIKGDQLEVMNLPEAYVIASPDLKLMVSPQTAKVSGTVKIPTAELAPMDFNTTVSASQDVVIVGQEMDDEKMRLATDVDVTVQLGDKVMIRALGFRGRLGGNLRIYGDAGELLLGNGQITVNDGSYAAYGRELTVNNGRVLFSGAAIDNPDLDIKAIRKGTNYQAGIHITGPANNPQATLFSVPSMSQEDILSYIVLGRPLGQASAADAAMLASAETNLGISNGNAISEQIASTFGLDSVEFTGESPDTAAVQIGKYLSPKLYLGYGIGIFEPVSTVQLRYTLSKIWTLQAESGTHSGVDLLYIYER